MHAVCVVCEHTHNLALFCTHTHTHTHTHTTTTQHHNDNSSWRIFSIDPITARDLDDALSIEPLPPAADGSERWRVGVHIADVAAFVRPGTALDEEAMLRGTST